MEEQEDQRIPIPFEYDLAQPASVWHQYAQCGPLFYRSSDLLLEVLLLHVFQGERIMILTAVFSPFCKAIFD